MRASVSLVFVVVVVLGGCGGAATEPAPAPVPPASCAPPELSLPDGSCIRPGVPPDGCAPGFVHDGEYGCEPILPPERCPPGLMAVPGDTTCRPVMPCGAGRWGDIPLDATTVYVDGSYTGTDSDGSDARPWTTVADGVDAAAPGALVAIAAGSYVEDVVVTGKAVRLWGVCPDAVSIVATGQPGLCPPAALCVHSNADGTEVHGVALTGPGLGVMLSGSEQVLVDRVRVHDTSDRGINVQDSLGPTALDVRGSLIEQSNEYGLFVMGSDAIVEATVVRATQPRVSDQAFGRGIGVQLSCETLMGSTVCDPAARASATVRGSVLEENHEVGLSVTGSDATLEATVVRATQPRASNQALGRGIAIQLPCTETSMGLPVCDPAARASATVRGSLVQDSHDAGLFVSGSDVIVEATVVRATQPRASDQAGGRGISIHPPCYDTPMGLVCDSTQRASATVRGSLVEESHELGLSIVGSDATVESTVVRATHPRPSDQAGGRGINIQGTCVGPACDPAARASATVRGSLIEKSHDVGISAEGSDAIVEASVVRATLPQLLDGLFGDGITALRHTSAVITGVRIEDNARAGVASFGAHVALGSSRLRCNAFDLEGEPDKGTDFVFEDLGDNSCGCPEPVAGCTAVSAGLTPPTAIFAVQ